MHVPSSTYRIQLHKNFTFRDLQRIVEYLHTLGVSTIYASPITQAAPGSLHGYDVTDPHAINSEIGDMDDLRALERDLRKKDMSWLQDIVPNHMAFHPSNARLMDVLERGPQSPYFNYFDIDWNHPSPDLKGKLMLPFLGDAPDKCIERGELRLSFSDQGFFLSYFDTHYPVSLPAYKFMLSRTDDGDGTLPSILGAMVTAADELDLKTWSAVKREFISAITTDEDVNAAAIAMTEAVNINKATLRELLEHLYYRPAYWKDTDTRINYRRFFTVNELICLRMEDEKVFREYHSFITRLLKEKLIHGLRIDHIDGLSDPAQYTQALRELTGDGCYIIAEKILEAREDMPRPWPLQGTSGYEFLSFLNGVLTLRKGAKSLLAFYRELLPSMPPYETVILQSKRLILENYMRGEWNNITELFVSLRLSEGFARERIQEALGYFMLALPVYRIYPDSLPLKGNSLVIVQEAFDKALKEGPAFVPEINCLRALLTEPQKEEKTGPILIFVKRLMQFTGPLTAKGVEDTTFYIYNPLISHDEVGDSPAPLGMSVSRFHEKMEKRQAATPLSLNATATHDTKRGEDARVRINVLSRIPELWKAHVNQWLDINKPFHTTIDGRTVPELNDEYFIYQSMLGGFPEDFTVTPEWINRVQDYLSKALREAKTNTNWSDPDEQYEKGCAKFVEEILRRDHSFLSSFLPFVKTVCEHALVYSLSQTLIKLTAPGIPDIYQGGELWDLSFVDPDNRRPVDFTKRMEFLFQLLLKEEKGRDALFAYLEEHRQEGIEKLYVIWKTLNFRKRKPALFTEGTYIPLAVTGSHVSAMGFARNLNDDWVAVIIPLGLPKRDSTGADTPFVVLPDDAPSRWYSVLAAEYHTSPNQLALADVLKNFPVALLVNTPPDAAA